MELLVQFDLAKPNPIIYDDGIVSLELRDVSLNPTKETSMKSTILTAIAMTTSIAVNSVAAEFQTDAFKTKGGKEIVITAIKHASLRIQYEGLEIQVDPVAKYQPATDYAKFPKADIILVTHEHSDHFDRSAIETLKKDGTQVIYL